MVFNSGRVAGGRGKAGLDYLFPILKSDQPVSEGDEDLRS